jgi:hypothetical protein
LYASVPIVRAASWSIEVPPPHDDGRGAQLRLLFLYVEDRWAKDGKRMKVGEEEKGPPAQPSNP